MSQQGGNTDGRSRGFERLGATDCSTSRESDADQPSLDQTLMHIERREIVAALKKANGQRTLAAQLLGISRSRLYRRMEALGIDPREPGLPGPQ
jgi:DNA-binding NtrC family response regulator